MAPIGGTGVEVMAMTFHLSLYYIALTSSTILRGGLKINVSRYVIKLDF